MTSTDNESRIANHVEIAVAQRTGTLRLIRHGRGFRGGWVEIADEFGCIETADSMAEAEDRVQEACNFGGASAA